MGQKVHPLGFRLGFTQDHQSHWYAKKSMYPLLIVEDRFIREYFQTKFADAGLVTIDISRKVDHVHVALTVGRPKPLVGSRGQKLEQVREALLAALKQFRLKTWTKEQRIAVGGPFLTLKVFTVQNTSSYASLLADDLADQLEKRIPFRRAMKTVLQRAERDNVPGIKIQVSGRLNGAEIARTEWIRKGRVPLQTLDAKIDYRARTAKTIYGLLGIKIWLFQGMKNDISVKEVKAPAPLLEAKTA
uniref:Small ribosomal subunit protein uS3c n=1 Tax=Medakamo hakoo TaxID=3113649 RepID=A0A8D5TC87_9CHLO|nr:ribosomal protein S3 [Medakamo hakoo]